MARISNKFFTAALLVLSSVLMVAAQTQRGGSKLSGTFVLDTNRSENSTEILAQADGGSLNSTDRAELEEKLRAPQRISIDVRGTSVSIDDGNGRADLSADGRSQTMPGGSTVRASLRNETLSITSFSKDGDFNVTFAPEDNGQTLHVTRRVTVRYLRESVFVDSFYTREGYSADNNTTSQPDDTTWSDSGTYSSSDQNDNRSGNTRQTGAPQVRRGSGDFIIPNGTNLTAVLESELNTKVSQENDRFRMTVQSPSEYSGAVIEGYISGLKRSGRVNGKPQLILNFETIRVNGRTYDFAGLIQSATGVDGKTVNIGKEGEVKGKDQTKETLKRGGIGAGVGAAIGAIFGGAQGAAIGAAIGGAGGAGTVAVTGKEDLELKSGTSIIIQSTSPGR